MIIEDIREKVKKKEFELSFHAHQERQAEEIKIEHIEESLLNGKILENYPDDPRGESCLVLGYAENHPIHTICG